MATRPYSLLENFMIRLLLFIEVKPLLLIILIFFSCSEHGQRLFLVFDGFLEITHFSTCCA